MTKIAINVETKSPFLQSLVPTFSPEKIQFGLLDCAVIGGFLLSFVSLICLIAK